MTAYHGGKQRIGKRLAEMIHTTCIDIEDKHDFTIKGYCEPFCGMLGVYQHIPELFEEKELAYKAGDANKSVILMWNKAKRGWKPPTKTTAETYEKLKVSKPSAEKAFIGHQCSFGGLYFRVFRKERCRDLTSASKNVQRISKLVRDVKFKYGKYTQFSNLKGYVIYCDPPYSQYSDYYEDVGDRFQGFGRKKIKFDHEEFWDWCRRMAEHNIVFVSEYTAPRDFKVVNKVKSNISHGRAGKSDKNIEKLYVIY
jgi:DNA adenine methylase